MSAILAAPKKQNSCYTRRQEQEMVSVFAKVFADKMVELAEVARISADAEDICTVTWGGDVMKVAVEMFRDPVWRQHYSTRSEYGLARKRRKIDIPLTTELHELDDKGKQQTELVTVSAIPLNAWKRSNLFKYGHFLDNDAHLARFVFEQACRWVHDDIRVWDAPIELRRTSKGHFKAIAASDIAPWCLKIPVFCDHVEKYLLPNSRFNRPKYEVKGSVSWTDAGQHKTINISCVAERKCLSLYPFWHIRRSGMSGECNCELGRVLHKTTMPCHDDEFELAIYSVHSDAFVARIPCIANPRAIKCGTEIVLTWDR